MFSYQTIASIVAGDARAWLAIALELILLAAAGYCLLSVAYCLAMLVAAARQKRAILHFSASDSPLRPPRTRFCILIPAHNEALVIEATLASVKALDYPPDLVRCVVIADNCTDDTADLARRVQNISVLERFDLQYRGKGYALNWALERILPDSSAQAIVVVDADTHVEPDFLTVMDRAIEASGEDASEFVAQGLYQVYNTGDNWRTALMAGALSLVHYVRPMARERWSTSVGLKGNGMCFAAPVAARLAWRGDSITEDIDYGLDLIENGGIRVRFVPDAVVRAQMPTDEAAAEGQRSRWEGGRSRIVRERALPMLRSGLLRRDRLRVDAALDLCCPPLAQLGAAFALWLAVIAAAAMLRAPGMLAWGAAWGLGIAGLCVYVLAGFRVGNAPKLAYRALGMAVVYIPWKIATVVRNKALNGWNRTARSSMEPAETAGDA